MKKVLLFFLLLFVSVFNCYAKDYDFWDVYMADEDIKLYYGDRLILNTDQDDYSEHVRLYCEKYPGETIMGTKYCRIYALGAPSADRIRINAVGKSNETTYGITLSDEQDSLIISMPSRETIYDDYIYFVVDRSDAPFHEGCSSVGLEFIRKIAYDYEPVIKIACTNDCDTNEYQCRFYIEYELEELKKKYNSEQIEQMLKYDYIDITTDMSQYYDYIYDGNQYKPLLLHYRINQENYKNIFSSDNSVGYFLVRDNEIEIGDIVYCNNHNCSGENWSNFTYITEASAWTDLATFTVDKDLIDDVLVIETEHSKIELPKNNEACDEEIKSEEKEEKDDFSEDSDVKGVSENPKTGVKNLLITIIPLSLLVIIGLVINNKDKIFKKI